MTLPRPCGCKGCRTCLVCETEYGADKFKLNLELDKQKGYVYCMFCKKAWKGWDVNAYKEHPNHQGDSIEFPGIYIIAEFLSKSDEIELVKNLDEIPWDISQSGRRKQNFGPKTNFKKRKIVPGMFDGFPECTKYIQESFSQIDLLKHYETIEQCSIEYDPTKGASIDPHIDDCWVWGERIITVNCLSDTVLTLTRYKGDKTKYNLHDATNYPATICPDGLIDPSFRTNEQNMLETCKPDVDSDVIVRVPMIRRSLVIMYGEPRYHWVHFVLREDIKSRRVIIAYREFTPTYLDNGPHSEIGQVIRDKAKNFWDHKLKYEVKQM